jgi:shikimate kinase
MPGSGKSKVAKKLAELLGIPFQDSDWYIEQKERKKIHEIFSENGEAAFRAMEVDWLKQPHPIGVYATGGGLPCHNNSMDLLLEKGVVFYLHAPESFLKERIANNSSRPMFSGLEDSEVLEFLKKLYGQRRQHYRRAHFSINVQGKSEEDIGNEIIAML